MSLDRAIAHGRERRRRYYRSAAFDPSCRPGGDCPWCQGNRTHQARKAEAAAREALAEVPDVLAERWERSFMEPEYLDRLADRRPAWMRRDA